jgi:hypothetical protein
MGYLINFTNSLAAYVCNRPYWRCYFPNTQAIIYVVDSSDTDRLVIAKDEFHAILEVLLSLFCAHIWVVDKVSVIGTSYT